LILKGKNMLSPMVGQTQHVGVLENDYVANNFLSGALAVSAGSGLVGAVTFVALKAIGYSTTVALAFASVPLTISALALTSAGLYVIALGSITLAVTVTAILIAAVINGIVRALFGRPEVQEEQHHPHNRRVN
jgi:hypothetical protein